MPTMQARLQSTWDRAATIFTAKSPDILTALVVFGLFLVFAIGVPRLLRRALRRANVPDPAVRVTRRIALLFFVFFGVLGALNELDIGLGAPCTAASPLV